VLCIRYDITDPFFNLAAEEYFLKESDQEFLILYINDPSVIIGKHQNAYGEINLEYVRENHIKVVRRISGGGTVWHDHGNLNFSFIRNGKEGNLVNFFKYSVPILDVLHKLDLNAEFKGKNSITINGLKISGMAEHIHKNRVLHHGTLLFKSDLSALVEALRADSAKYHSRAVKSVRSRTANISDLLNEKLEMAELRDEIFNHVMELNTGSDFYNLTASDHKAIQRLVHDKYSTWEWNFGYSPNYIFERKVIISGHNIDIFLRIEKGVIVEAKLSGDIFPESAVKKLESILLQRKHEENTIFEIMNQGDFKKFLHPADMENLIKSFF
jgi:lipoate-protein ligase A